MTVEINRQNTHILPSEFEYHAPERLDEALSLLEMLGPDARPLAGGTDLLVKMKQRVVEPKHIVNLKKITGLKGFEDDSSFIRIGCLTSLRDIEKSEIIGEKLPLLQETVVEMGSIQIRNMATLGGNLCNASPAADASVTLLAMDAEVEIAGLDGRSIMALEEFFKGPGQTVLKEGELLKAVSVPLPEKGSGHSFRKLRRISLDIATVNVAVTLSLDGESIIDSNVAIGAVAPTPLRLNIVEEYLKGKDATRETFKEAAELGCESISPITDVRATAEYRLAASKGLLMEALSIARGRAEGM